MDCQEGRAIVSAAGFLVSAIAAARGRSKDSTGGNGFAVFRTHFSFFVWQRRGQPRPVLQIQVGQVTAERMHPFEITVSWRTGKMSHTQTGVVPGSHYLWSLVTRDPWGAGPAQLCRCLPGCPASFHRRVRSCAHACRLIRMNPAFGKRPVTGPFHCRLQTQ